MYLVLKSIVDSRRGPVAPGPLLGKLLIHKKIEKKKPLVFHFSLNTLN